MANILFTVGELAEMTQSEIIGDPNLTITNVADLHSAEAEDVSFLANPRYERAMTHSKAGVVIVSSKDLLIEGRNFLINSNPTKAFQLLLETFHKQQELTAFRAIHPTAVIHDSSHIGSGVTIGPHAVIDEGAHIGDNTFIGAGTYIGREVSIGKESTIHPHVTIREQCSIGCRVVIHPGVVIGSCGFGFTSDERGRHHKLQQVGNVVVGDDVEIGANTTIDRSRFKSTVIGRGTKIDNLVQIAHGVKIGEDVIIVAQTGIAGSTTIGNHVVIGGQTGIAGHIEIAPKCGIAAMSGVSKTITKPGNYRGNPAVPIDLFNERFIETKNIGRLKKRVDELEKMVEKLLAGKE